MSGPFNPNFNAQFGGGPLTPRQATPFSALQTRVLSRIIDATTTVQNEVPALINLAIRDLEDDVNLPIMKAQTVFQTVLNTRLLVSAANNSLLAVMPSDYKERRKEPYWLDQVGNPVFMRWYTSHEGALQRFAPQELKNPAVQFTDIGPPQLLTVIAQLSDPTTGDGPQPVEVWPLPDVNGFDFLNDGVTKSYTIFVPYWRYVPDLVNPNDTNWFTANAEQYLVMQATGHAFMLDWNEQRAAYWFQMAQSYRNKIVRKAANEAASPMQGMAVRSDALAERDQWRRS